MAALRSIKADDQLGIDEIKVIQDADIEQALEAWQRAKDERAEKQLAVKNAKTKVEGLTGRLEMPDPTDEDNPIVVRVGRFRISKRFLKGKTVQFVTEDRVRMSFGLADAPDVDDVETDTDEDQDAIDRLESKYSKPAAVDETTEDDDLLPEA